IDFHWHVMHECCQPDSDRDFWDHAIPFNFQGIETLALCPADQLLHICVHSARFGSNTRLRWVADVMVILQNSPSDIDWNRLILQAKTRRLILPVRETLTYVKTRFNAPVPEDALQELDTVSLTPVDLFEYRYKRQNYHKKPLGYLPILWFDHCRLTGSVHFLRKLLGFPGYLQQFWGSETTRHALIFLLTACKQRLAAWQARRDATPDVYRPPGVTKPNLFRTSIRRFSGNTDRKKSVSIRVIRVIRVLFFYKKAVACGGTRNKSFAH
ncbi:MAG: nucleotidyltransferase family protein, partial [bacterium]|nr:nucleotidyltransferase family protein [bacterium]